MTDKLIKSFRYNGGVESIRYDQEPSPRESLPITKRPLGMTRRGFLAVAGNAVVAAGVAKVGLDHWRASEVDTAPTVTVSPEVVKPGLPIERIEQVELSEKFEDQLSTYRTQYSMTNEVLFVDSHNHFLGKHTIEPIDGISPGASYDGTYGIVTEGLAGEWREAAKLEVLKNHPGVLAETVDIKTNWNELKQAVSDPDELMTYDTVRSVVDIVRYFGEKVVQGGDGLSRIEYVGESIKFQGNLAKAPVVVAELKRLMPGICALESKFNDDVRSSVDAHSIFQFKPGTWEDELKRPAVQKGEHVSLAEQVAAAGELFSKMYDRLQYWCYEEENYSGQNYLEEIKTLFSSQEDFEKYFLVPCLINCYNTGEKGMGEVVVGFAQSAEFRELTKNEVKQGYDLFQATCDFGMQSELSTLADYKAEASTYTQRAYALAGLLNQDSAEGERVAQL